MLVVKQLTMKLHPLFYLAKVRVWLLRKRKDNYIKNLVRKGLKLGKKVDIIDTFFFDPAHCYLISIGDNCTICPNVRLIAHDASTKKHIGYTKIGRIEVGKNCFLGDSVIVLPAVSIGSNSIIGAGSVVTHDIPSGSVAAGNPARVIMTTKEYIGKVFPCNESKIIFNEEYLMENIDSKKVKEMNETLCNKVGFIV